MESFLSRYKNPLVLLAVLFAQVIGLAVQIRRPSVAASAAPGDVGGVRLVRSWALDIIAPPENVVHSAGLGVRGVWQNYIDLIHTNRENQQLKDEIDRLRLEQANLAENARQAQRLQALLAFREKYIYQTLPAQVIGASGSDQSHLLILDKGSADGLKRDMAVITPDGIVGRIRDVFPHTSQLLEVSDATSGAGVVLETTRIRGVLRGNAYGQPEIVDLLPDSRIKPGDVVLTSGGDQIFPRGLAVGTVDRVVPDPDRDPLVNVLIRPAANLSRLEEVLVVTSTGAQVPQQELHDVAQSELDLEQQKAADILAERLPSRVDDNAPPEELLSFNVDGSAADETVAKPLHPPLPEHPDQFSPSAAPPAADLSPGQRIGRVLDGTEDGPARPRPVVTAPNSAAPASSVSHAAAPGTKKPENPLTTSAPRKPAAAASHPESSHVKPAEPSAPQGDR